MKRALIVVEGPHDVELVGTMLRSLVLAPKPKRIRFKRDLEPFWHPLVPTEFPIDDDMAARVPVPVFFGTTTHSVAVLNVGGDSRLLPALEESLAMLAGGADMVGIVMDADDRQPSERWSALVDSSAAEDLEIGLPRVAGRIDTGPPRVGGFILPDGASEGTLEDLMLDAASIVYPELLDHARAYTDNALELAKAQRGPLSGKAWKQEWKLFVDKPAGRRKALVASMGAVLRPGKAIQNSIQDNRWFRDPEALKHPRIAAVRVWLADLLELPLPAAG